MLITKVHIKNFKIFKGSFKLELNKGLNILVGDNEAGKSTIIEAIHLVLSGLHNGRYLRNELSQYLFNNEVVADYLESLEEGKTPKPLPEILKNKYPVGSKIVANEPDIKNTTLTGSLKIEVPKSNELSPRLSEFKAIAQKHGIELVFEPE